MNKLGLAFLARINRVLSEQTPGGTPKSQHNVIAYQEEKPIPVKTKIFKYDDDADESKIEELRDKQFYLHDQ